MSEMQINRNLGTGSSLGTTGRPGLNGSATTQRQVATAATGSASDNANVSIGAGLEQVGRPNRPAAPDALVQREQTAATQDTRLERTQDVRPATPDVLITREVTMGTLDADVDPTK